MCDLCDRLRFERGRCVITPIAALVGSRSFIGVATAANSANKDDAVAMVKKAVTFIEEQDADNGLHGAKTRTSPSGVR
jgi:hypothetical protein